MGGSQMDSDVSSLFHRRIEFHLAKKPFNGLISTPGFQLETLNPNKDNGPTQNFVTATPDPNALDPELSLGISFRKIMRIGGGLQNLGNTCFLNSVLQCLTYTEPLAAYLESGKHQNSCRMAGFCALCAIQKHVTRALQATGKILAPKDLVSNLRCISRNFRNARQEDAHEYMVNLLESMHKCCLPSGVPSESPSAYDKSLVHKIFGGRLRSQVQCMQCNFCSDKFDPFLDLSLEILKADSLHRALEHFTARELLDGGQKQYQCQKCKQKVKATKRLTVDKAPHVLTIHLKRFGSHVPGQKIDKKIHYGPTLDIKQFVSGTYGSELKYTLYGVLVHAGWSTHSGHYYCFVRTSSGLWYSLDDNQVVQVSEKRVLEQKAYMLFYVRNRKSPILKKSVDVACNNNVMANGLGNKASNPNQRFKDSIPNGFCVKNMDFSSGAKDQRETVSAEVSKGSSINGPMANGVVANKSPSMKGAIQLENLPKLPETVTRSEDVEDTRNRPCILYASSSVPVSNGIRRLESNGGKRSEDSISLCNGNGKDLTNSAVIPYSCGSIINDKNPSISREMLNIGLHKQEQYGNGNANTQLAKDISNDRSGDSADEVNHDVGQRVFVPRERVVSQLTMTSSSEKETPGKAWLKAKKKCFKSRVTKMHLSFMILDPTWRRHKQKKHKRVKCKIGRKKHCDPRSLDENNLSSDLGPSTSKLARTLISSSMHSQRKKSKCGADEKINGLDTKTAGHNKEQLRSSIDDVRVVNNGSVLANDKQLQKSHKSESGGNQCDRRCDAQQTNRESTQKGLVNMLTRGLESSIPRWDDVNVPSFDGFEGQNVNCISIGYIGDDWDEEYDRGKRKKVRSSKIEFGGPNPFQEFASKKSKAKKARVDRSVSANQPFRIL